MKTEVLIVGGGLSGLAVVDQLNASGIDYVLVEAADQFGGRILTKKIETASFDLGPAWYWSGQPRMAAMVKRFGLKRFEQYSEGAIVFQDQEGSVQRYNDFASMQGSYRIEGGMRQLIYGLQNNLPSEHLYTNAQVETLTRSSTGITATFKAGGSIKTIEAKKVVLSIPPRIAGETIEFSPALPEYVRKSLENIPTWMAGHAKVLAVYDHPYWRETGLSGDGMSQKGPMVEIHDASPKEGGPYALFGFVGFPPSLRKQHMKSILDLAKDQLVAMFGPEMSNPLDIRLRDWARNPLIATQKDYVSPRSHPVYGVPRELTGLWSGDLIISSTEMGHQFGGFLEGALEAADATANRLIG